MLTRHCLPWTAKEISTLRSLTADGLAPNEIGERMGRTGQAIRDKLIVIGLGPAKNRKRTDTLKPEHGGDYWANRFEWNAKFCAAMEAAGYVKIGGIRSPTNGAGSSR